MNGTISYYDLNAKRFYEDTVHADMSTLYKPFLELVPKGGSILDAGCGSGRDSLYFLHHGYHVEAFDASSEMCRLASDLTGKTVRRKTFNEVEWDSEFDGVWACASLLHVQRHVIDVALGRLCRALKPNGVMFVSFKLRDEEWQQDGRLFNGYGDETFRDLIKGHPALLLSSIWVSNDTRPERKDEKWLNSILQRISRSL